MDGWMERASGEASERSGECRESNGAPNFPSIFREITMASLSLSSPSAVLSRIKYPFEGHFLFSERRTDSDLSAVHVEAGYLGLWRRLVVQFQICNQSGLAGLLTGHMQEL